MKLRPPPPRTTVPEVVPLLAAAALHGGFVQQHVLPALQLPVVAATGRVTILQDSLLSTRLNLRTSMTLEAVEDRDAWSMQLRRLSVPNSLL